MDAFEFYIFKSFISIAVFYLFYLLILKKETSFNWNRGFLLFTGVFSMLVPLISFNFPAEGLGYDITVYLSPVLISPKANSLSSVSDSSRILPVFYFAILSIFIGKFLFKVFRIFALSRGKKEIRIHGYRTVIMDKIHSPFSFFKTVYLPANEFDKSSMDEIIRHEAVHIDESHSIDLIIYELVTACQWFNPFAWLCRKELIAQHEFSADAKVISDGADTARYKNLILSYSLQLGGSSVTNNFNSLIKRRFEMLSNKNPGKRGKIKLLFSLPVVALLVLVFGCHTELGKSSMSSAVEPEDVPFAKTEEQHNVYAKNMPLPDEMPTYPKGVDELLKFIGQNVQYPKAAKDNQVQGKVMVSFIVEADGSVTDIKVDKGIGYGCDEEAVRVTKLMGKWNPGKKDGKTVRAGMFLPFQFKLQ